MKLQKNRSTLNEKLIFLAGATGMAGTSILVHILNNYPGAKVRASYYKNTRPFIKNERVDYVDGDLTSLEDCKRMASGCDCAVMAAAYTGGAGIIRSFPWRHIKENLLMNTQMIEAFQLENIKRVIYIGSATLYQEFEGSIKEDELDLNKDPNQAYLGFGWVVRFIEKLCKFLYEQNGMEIVVARVANIFGPYAKFDPKTSNFIPAIIRKAIDKMDPFEVWGSPDVIRDVIYSDDFARAIVMMLDNGNVKFDVFNVGSGVKVSVGEVVNLALKYAGHTPKEVKYIQDKPTTMNFRALDCTKIKNTLGWQAQNTVEEGIRKTTEWWFENKGRWNK